MPDQPNDPAFQKALNDLAAREPEPHEMVSSFDAASWSMVAALTRLLIDKDILKPSMLPELQQYVFRIMEDFKQAGETQRVEATGHVIEWIADMADHHGIAITRVERRDQP